MSRKQGRIILIGTAGLQINRSDFYEKELTFQVSCSYGPGRYDLEYEKMAWIILFTMLDGQSGGILRQFWK